MLNAALSFVLYHPRPGRAIRHGFYTMMVSTMLATYPARLILYLCARKDRETILFTVFLRNADGATDNTDIQILQSRSCGSIARAVHHLN